MLGLTRSINEWTMKKFEGIEMDDKHPYIKAFALGALDGAVDAVAVIGVVSIIATVIQTVKICKEEE